MIRCILLFLLIFQLQAHGQEGRISLRVTVLDSATLEPLDSVKVTLFQGRKKKKAVFFNRCYEQGSDKKFLITEKSVFEKVGYKTSKIKGQYMVRNDVAEVKVLLPRKKTSSGVKLIKPG